MSTKQTEALKLADELDAEFAQGRISNHTGRKAAQFIREALAEQPAQQQEPFALLVRKHSWNKGQYECAPPNVPEYGRQWADERVWVYTSPPASKPWVGLTNEEIDELDRKNYGFPQPVAWRGPFARAVEAKLKERNA